MKNRKKNRKKIRYQVEITLEIDAPHSWSKDELESLAIDLVRNRNLTNWDLTEIDFYIRDAIINDI